MNMKEKEELKKIAFIYQNTIKYDYEFILALNL